MWCRASNRLPLRKPDINTGQFICNRIFQNGTNNHFHWRWPGVEVFLSFGLSKHFLTKLTSQLRQKLNCAVGSLCAGRAQNRERSDSKTCITLFSEDTWKFPAGNPFKYCPIELYQSWKFHHVDFNWSGDVTVSEKLPIHIGRTWEQSLQSFSVSSINKSKRIHIHDRNSSIKQSSKRFCGWANYNKHVNRILENLHNLFFPTKHLWFKQTHRQVFLFLRPSRNSDFFAKPNEKIVKIMKRSAINQSSDQSMALLVARFRCTDIR